MTPQATVEAFIGHWNSCDIEAMLALCAEGIVYHNIPMEPIHGTAAVRVMGTFELDENGLIAAWRDYFDMGEMQREFAGG